MKRFLIKTYYFFTNPFRKLYWFVIKPQTRGVKVIIELNNKFLLVKLSYAHKKFTLPGGGVKKHESFEEGARREAFEEVGIKLEKLEKIFEYKSNREYKQDTVEVFYSRVNSDYFEIDGIEIEEAGWFSVDNLPVNSAPRMPEFVEIIRKFKNQN